MQENKQHSVSDVAGALDVPQPAQSRALEGALTDNLRLLRLAVINGSADGRTVDPAKLTVATPFKLQECAVPKVAPYADLEPSPATALLLPIYLGTAISTLSHDDPATDAFRQAILELRALLQAARGHGAPIVAVSLEPLLGKSLKNRSRDDAMRGLQGALLELRFDAEAAGVALALLITAECETDPLWIDDFVAELVTPWITVAFDIAPHLHHRIDWITQFGGRLGWIRLIDDDVMWTETDWSRIVTSVSAARFRGIVSCDASLAASTMTKLRGVVP